MVALFIHSKHQRDPMQWIVLTVAQLPSSCLKACKALCVAATLPAASRMPSGATAASMLQQLGGSERACRSGVWRHAYTNLNRHWLACGRLKLRAVPSQGRMPMAPSAMRHEQCSTCTQLAGQLSARRWLADDTSEPGNTSGSVAIVRLPDEPKDWAALCCAEGCPAFVRAPARAMSHAMKANAATLHLILDDESLEYVVWRPA